jgi:surface antigen
MHMLNKLSACILTGTLILSGMTSTVKADENMIYTDHHTYYIGTVEYNEDGTVVDASHVCNMQVHTPPTTDGNDTDVTPDPEPSEPTEPVTPTPEPVNPAPDQDGSTATDKKEPSIGDITILPEPDVPDTNDDTNDIITAPSGGYISSVKNALKLDNYISLDWSKFILVGNPFAMPQCTYYAWSRFYQVYGFSSGAFGNGKDNAREIVAVHGDKFSLSSTPSGGAVFSAQADTRYPEFGHVGFVEAFDGTNLWISEGNYTLSNGDNGYIHIYRTTLQAFKAMYPDVVFAVPNGSVLESSLLSDLSLYSMTSGLNVTNISADDSKVNAKKLKYKNTKRKNTIYYENGEKIQQYKLKPADEKVVSEV